MGKKQGKSEMIPSRTCITERPEFINNKSEFGHWMGDSIVSSKSFVMVGRQTYVSIRSVENRGPEASMNAMKNSNQNWQWIPISVNLIVVGKGGEQVNGLIRRFLPKKTDLSLIEDKEIKLIEYLFNSRPRELLGWYTPAEVFAKKSKIKLVDGALAT